MANQELNAVVTQKEVINERLIVIRVVPEGWELPEFIPGQFTVLGLPGTAPYRSDCEPYETPKNPEKLIRRAYSIASSSVAKEYLEFLLALVNSGSLTPRLFNLDKGDKVFLSPKFAGYFTLEQVPPEANVILIATGTGLAPYMSMVRTELFKGNREHLAILHGAAFSGDLAYSDELKSLEATKDRFSYFPIIDKPEQETTPWSGPVGFVQDIWKDNLIEEKWGFRPTPENTHVFLCGNPAMIEEMEVLLQAEGFKEHSRKEAGQYHLERYW